MKRTSLTIANFLYGTKICSEANSCFNGDQEANQLVLLLVMAHQANYSSCCKCEVYSLQLKYQQQQLVVVVTVEAVLVVLV